MQTECSAGAYEFPASCGRRVVARFDGGCMSSDGGVILVKQADDILGLSCRFAACFRDKRHPGFVEYRVEDLVRQRILGLALGYEDLNDHDALRHDLIFGLASGRLSGGRANCAALAGKSTLNRLERSGHKADRYCRIIADHEALATLFVTLFLDQHERAPARIVLDVDATDDRIHGHQEGRAFHGYYGHNCYLPLYIFCGDHLLSATLRTADRDPGKEALADIRRIVEQIRSRWPRVRILVRGDSGFARDSLMTWCEDNHVDFLFGLAGNTRLYDRIASLSAEVRDEAATTGRAARGFASFDWITKDSWTRRRRVVAKAEWRHGNRYHRFIVTTLPQGMSDPRHLYEQIYCARGDMENRIKECQMDLFSDRTSSHTIRANQLRLWFSAAAYVLLSALQRLALGQTSLETATCGTIRARLLKIATRVTLSVRRIVLSMPDMFPCQHEFALAHARLRRLRQAI